MKINKEMLNLTKEDLIQMLNHYKKKCSEETGYISGTKQEIIDEINKYKKKFKIKHPLNSSVNIAARETNPKLVRSFYVKEETAKS